jgi:hypothetical protein
VFILTLATPSPEVESAESPSCGEEVKVATSADQAAVVATALSKHARPLPRAATGYREKAMVRKEVADQPHCGSTEARSLANELANSA